MAASAAIRFLSSGFMDLPVASCAINYDNQRQAAQDIALFCFAIFAQPLICGLCERINF
jgi:hypothetical protein